MQWGAEADAKVRLHIIFTDRGFFWGSDIFWRSSISLDLVWNGGYGVLTSVAALYARFEDP